MTIFGKLFSKRQEIEILTFDPEDYGILFKSESTLEPGEYAAQATVGEHKLRCDVRMESVEAGLYYGTFLKPQEAGEHLSVLVPRPKLKEEKRGAERVERVLRISSSGLPNYQATSSDLSTTGIQLKVESAMRTSYEFDCTLEFDDHTMQRLEVTCKVRWCRPVEDKYLVGASFVEPPKATQSRIAYFIKSLTSVERGVLSGSHQYFD